MLSIITPTHNPKYLSQIYDCLVAQTNQDWEWIVACDCDKIRAIYQLGEDDTRIRYIEVPERYKGIGAIKKFAFMQGRGDYLVELDHDDLLCRTALSTIEHAFEYAQADFVYSNYSEFFENGLFHYYPNWQQNGWQYRTALVDGKEWNECVAFEPSAASLSLIYYAPNHVRAWKRDFYHEIGGHNSTFELCDDHELLIRTYLKGRMYHIDECLYFYRMGEQNTFSKNLGKIQEMTYKLYAKYLEQLILREGELKGLPCYDLGGAFSKPEGWISVDLEGGDVTADLSKRWPFEDNSILAFRAHDFVEHIADKQHVMKELYRCLVPGGWALISVPSALGQGAHQDPTHVSYWVQNSFRYYTDPVLARYIRNTEHHFIESRNFEFMDGAIPYVKAELRKIGCNQEKLPGFNKFS